MFGVFTGAAAAVMIKECTLPSVLLASWRQLVAVIVLLPLFLSDWRRFKGVFGWRQVRMTIWPGIFLGGHFITWIIGVHLTNVANASLVVNMLPAAMPFLAYFMVHERLTRGEVLGTLLALAGVVLLAVHDFHLSWTSFSGDVMCFFSMLLFAVYMALARRNGKAFPSIWLYVVPVYMFGGIFCMLAAVPQMCLGQLEPIDSTLKNWLLLVGLGIIPTVIGHSVLNYSMKHMRSQVVSIANLAQFIYAGAMWWVLKREAPNWSFYPASLLVVVGCVAALLSMPKAEQAELAAEQSEAA